MLGIQCEISLELPEWMDYEWALENNINLYALGENPDGFGGQLGHMFNVPALPPVGSIIVVIDVIEMVEVAVSEIKFFLSSDGAPEITVYTTFRRTVKEHEWRKIVEQLLQQGWK